MGKASPIPEENAVSFILYAERNPKREEGEKKTSRAISKIPYCIQIPASTGEDQTRLCQWILPQRKGFPRSDLLDENDKKPIGKSLHALLNHVYTNSKNLEEGEGDKNLGNDWDSYIPIITDKEESEMHLFLLGRPRKLSGMGLDSVNEKMEEATKSSLLAYVYKLETIQTAENSVKPVPESPKEENQEETHTTPRVELEYEWKMLGSDRKKQLLLYGDSGPIKIIDDSTGSELEIIRPYYGIEYTRLEPSFCCVLVNEDTVLGFRFNKTTDEEQFLLHCLSIVKSANELKSKREEELKEARYNGPLLGCVALTIHSNINTKDESSIGIAFCTELQQPSSLAPLLSENFLKHLGNCSSHNEKLCLLQSLYMKLNKSNPRSSMRFLSEANNKNNILETLLPNPLVLKPRTSLHGWDHLKLAATGSFFLLLQSFGVTGLISLHSVVMACKKIVFVGSNAHLISRISSAAMSICPPLVWSPVHSYFPWQQAMNFEPSLRDSNFYVCGILDRTSAESDRSGWDVIADVATGSITAINQDVQRLLQFSNSISGIVAFELQRIAPNTTEMIGLEHVHSNNLVTDEHIERKIHSILMKYTISILTDLENLTKLPQDLKPVPTSPVLSPRGMTTANPNTVVHRWKGSETRLQMLKKSPRVQHYLAAKQQSLLFSLHPSPLESLNFLSSGEALDEQQILYHLSILSNLCEKSPKLRVELRSVMSIFQCTESISSLLLHPSSQIQQAVKKFLLEAIKCMDNVNESSGSNIGGFKREPEASGFGSHYNPYFVWLVSSVLPPNNQ